MKKIRYIFYLILLISSLFLFNQCSGVGVTVGVGVYVPGAWGPYHGPYYPPIGIGYPIY